MAEIYLASDHHFNHANILKFLNPDGTKLRPDFSCLDEMNEELIRRHNSVVGHYDYFYCGGDFAFGPAFKIRPIISRMNGKKRLILGNHDDVIKQELYKYFDKIMLWRVFREEKLVVTHVPIPVSQFKTADEVNLHGHLHSGKMMVDSVKWPAKEDPHYISMCVEHTNYTPLHITEFVKRIKDR